MIAKVLLAFTVFAIAFVAYCEVGAQSYNYCERNETQITKWDSCNANHLGNWKSVSKCYYASKSARWVARYDYYTCRKQQLGSNVYYFILPKNCTGPQAPIIGDDGLIDVFNRYDEVSKRCNLVPPPPPTEEATTETSTDANTDPTDPPAGAFDF